MKLSTVLCNKTWGRGWKETLHEEAGSGKYIHWATDGKIMLWIENGSSSHHHRNSFWNFYLPAEEQRDKVSEEGAPGQHGEEGAGRALRVQP